jgi:tetratricopeptide (TPR) repeat protein
MDVLPGTPEMAMDPVPTTDPTPVTAETPTEPVPTADATPVPAPSPTAVPPEILAQAKQLYDDYGRNEVRSTLARLEKLAQEHPTAAPVLAYLADLHYQKGRIKKARELARRAAELDADTALAWWIIGLVAYEDRQKAVYIEAFGNYLRLSPNDQKAKDIRRLRIRELSGP